MTRPTRPGFRGRSLKLSVRPYIPAYNFAPSMGTSISVAPRPHQNLSEPTASADNATFIPPTPPPSVAACAGPNNGYHNLCCTTSLSVRGLTGPTNGYHNLHCAAFPQFQPVSALSTGTAISIAPPTSRYQPVPVPPTDTAFSIAPHPLRTSQYCPHQRGNIYCPAPLHQLQPVPVQPAGAEAPIAPPHPQYRPAATSPTAARTRLPAPSGAITLTARVPSVVLHRNSPLPLLTDPLLHLKLF